MASTACSNVFVGTTDDFHCLFSGGAFGKGGVITARVADRIELRNVLTEGDQFRRILEWLRVAQWVNIM